MINLTDLSRIYAKTYGASLKDSATICESVFNLVRTLIFDEGEDIQIHRFGTFKHKAMQEKKVVHPGTGEEMIIPAKTVVKFKQSETTNEDNN